VFAEWGVKRATVLIEVDRAWSDGVLVGCRVSHDEQVIRHVGTF